MVFNEICILKECLIVNDLLLGLRSNFCVSEVGVKSYFVWCKVDCYLIMFFIIG